MSAADLEASYRRLDVQQPFLWLEDQCSAKSAHCPSVRVTSTSPLVADHLSPDCISFPCDVFSLVHLQLPLGGGKVTLGNASCIQLY